MSWGRAYFAVQSVAGALWWVAVFVVPQVRVSTLGSLPPVIVAIADIPLFVGASALAAFGLRWAAVVATGWTALVAVSLAVYATITGEAGLGVLAMAAAVGGSALALTLILLGRVPTEWIARGPFAFKLADAGAATIAHVGRTTAQIIVFWSLFLGIIPGVLVVLEARWGFALPPSGVVSGIGVVILILASALGLWSAAAMSITGGGTPLPSSMANSLVIAGPYRFVRNPMAVAESCRGWRSGSSSRRGSWWSTRSADRCCGTT
ncbi:MAG: hypothetical protein RI885_2420 [Actinomycetota bacterium]